LQCRRSEWRVRALIQAIIALSASAGGVFVLAALDSTVFVALPFGVDLAVIGLAAQAGTWRWAVPILAMLGSLAGAAATYWMGAKIGDKGLERFASPRRLARIRKATEQPNPLVLTAFELMPPPFPFTLFVLAAGALHVRRSTFFITLAACRFVRFGLETVLAWPYGPQIIEWMSSDAMNQTVKWLIAACVVATLFGLFRVLRSSRPALTPT
jgi:membrane protein YqaA with SNARE-associated domain